MIYVVAIKVLRHVLCSSLVGNGEGTVKIFAMRRGDGKWFCAMCGNGDGEGKKFTCGKGTVKKTIYRAMR